MAAGVHVVSVRNGFKKNRVRNGIAYARERPQRGVPNLGHIEGGRRCALLAQIPVVIGLLEGGEVGLAGGHAADGGGDVDFHQSQAGLCDQEIRARELCGQVDVSGIAH